MSDYSLQRLAAWELWLPDHRKLRPELPWWEGTRLLAMNHFMSQKPGGVTIDVGAEEGDQSCLYAMWGQRVILFEPSLKNLAIARETFSRNDVEPWHVEAVFAGSEVLGVNGEEAPTHLFQANRNVDTIDNAIGNMACDVDFITIDVEGAELIVLRGATRILERDRPIVFVSVHEVSREWYGTTEADLHAFMTRASYEPVFLCRDHERHYLYMPVEMMWPR